MKIFRNFSVRYVANKSDNAMLDVNPLLDETLKRRKVFNFNTYL